MPGRPDPRRYQRFDPSTAWMARGSDPAAHRSARPDRPTSTRRPARPPTPVLAPSQRARARHGRTVRRRRRRPVRHLLFLPFRRVLVNYVRALIRALLPWLLPLALLAALPRILALLGGH